MDMAEQAALDGRGLICLDADVHVRLHVVDPRAARRREGTARARILEHAAVLLPPSNKAGGQPA